MDFICLGPWLKDEPVNRSPGELMSFFSTPLCAVPIATQQSAVERSVEEGLKTGPSHIGVEKRLSRNAFSFERVFSFKL